MLTQTIHKRLGLTLFLTIFTACGTNVLETQEKEDPAEDATLALEAGNPDEAIDILEKALEDDPGDAQLTSILASAYAQRAGVEPLTFAAGFATDDDSDEDSASADDDGFSKMFAILPEPTGTVLSDINQSVTLLNSIPNADRLTGDTFKLAMFQTASMVLTTKSFDADLDGDLTVEELQNLTPEQATALLSQIDSIDTLLASQGGDDTSAGAAETITKFKDDIDSQPGATDEEKLVNFLASSEEE